MSIKIGNNNKIKKSVIAVNSKIPEKQTKRKWYENHPVIIAVVAAVIAGVILKFAIWDELIQVIENVIGG